MTNLQEFPIFPGDVVLINNHGAKANLNKLGQLALTGQYPHFTHVMLSMNHSGILLDSQPMEGVKLRSIYDEISSGTLSSDRFKNNDVLVIRNEAIATWDMEVSENIFKSYCLNYKKKYNFYIGMPNISDQDSNATAKRVFCSELCFLMLEQLNVLPTDKNNNFPRRASGALPVHFERLVTEGWGDVTQKWLENISSIERSRSVGLELACINEGILANLIQITELQVEAAEEEEELIKIRNCCSQIDALAKKYGLPPYKK